jgi:hypothetical protein
MKRILYIILLSGLTSCSENSETSDKMNDVKKKIEEMESKVIITDDQIVRKAKSEKFINTTGIKLNTNLPYVESEGETKLRTPKEVAQRVSVLAAVNLVAFNNFSSKDIIDYLKRYNLWTFTTEKEKAFLANPTQAAKVDESWKVEGIWTLLWSLKVVPDLEFPKELADLNKIAPESYPFRGLNKDPNIFIAKMTELRSKSEILDASDLYYRIDWACVDAREKKTAMEKVNSSVVYERHYALNWLVNYMDEEWDEITCDT